MTHIVFFKFLSNNNKKQLIFTSSKFCSFSAISYESFKDFLPFEISRQEIFKVKMDGLCAPCPSCEQVHLPLPKRDQCFYSFLHIPTPNSFNQHRRSEYYSALIIYPSSKVDNQNTILILYKKNYVHNLFCYLLSLEFLCL